MSVQAYWNLDVGPQNREGDLVETRQNMNELKNRVDVLAHLETQARSFAGVESKVHNLSGEDVELEISGNVYRMIQFLRTKTSYLARDIVEPHIIWVNSQVEFDVVREEIDDKGMFQVDIEIRDA